MLRTVEGLIKRGNDATQQIFVPLVYSLMTSKTEDHKVNILI